MEFDDVLQQYVGEFGLYQLLFYFGASSVGILTGIGTLEYSFIGASPQHWCHVTELNTYNFTASEIESYVSPPLADSGYDACSMYERNYANVTEEDIWSFVHGNHSNSDNLTETPCNVWIYDKSDYHSTVITEVGNKIAFDGA